MSLPPAIISRLAKEGCTSRFVADALGIRVRQASQLLREAGARITCHGLALWKTADAPRKNWQP